MRDWPALLTRRSSRSIGSDPASLSSPAPGPTLDHVKAGRRWPKLLPVPPRVGSVAERALAVELACRSAMQLLEGLPDRDERLRRVDPIPASTTAHLRRLAASRRG